MSISLVGTALNLHEGETFAQWRERIARERQAKAAKIKEEISNVGLDADIVIETCQEKFQEAAEESDASYGDKWDDGSDSFSVSDEWEDENFFLSLEGKGTAYRSRGARGDGYLTPDDPDEITYSVNSAKLTVYRDDDEVGEWEIGSLLEGK